MTNQQKAEYERDMKAFRDEFIKDLSRKLALCIWDELDEYELENVESLLRNRLPSIEHCNYAAVKTDQ